MFEQFNNPVWYFREQRSPIPREIRRRPHQNRRKKEEVVAKPRKRCSKHWHIWNICCDYPKMSLVTRKPVFGFAIRLRLKPACSATGTSKNLKVVSVASIFSRQWTTKALIRLRIRAGWSASLLFAYSINRVSHGVAQIWWCWFYTTLHVQKM